MCQRYAHGSSCFDLNLSFTHQSSTKTDLHRSSNFYWNYSTQQDLIKMEFPHCRLCHVHVSKCFDCTSLSTQQHSSKLDLPLCRLHHVHGSFCFDNFLECDMEWNSFLMKAHGVQDLNCTSKHTFHGSSHIPIHQPATLASCALQALDNMGILDFNIQDPYSMETALTCIGAIDQLPVHEASMQQKKTHKNVSFLIPEDGDGNDTGSMISLNSKNGQRFSLRSLSKKYLKSLRSLKT